uniref:Uncharacterized protein n=1 Tax=Ixodes ricinus TaxID=34613 RepID=A0A131XYG3_IXORI
MTAFVDAECSQLMDSLTTFSLPGTSAKDYADFKSRIETFFDDYGTLSRWPCKPPELSPPQCARFGWTCANESMLVCVACKEYLDCEVSSSLGRKLHKECLSRLVSSLEGAHKPCCPWKTAPCPKSYTVMQPVLRKDALSQLRERLETLGPISSALPVLNTDKIYSLLSPEDILKIGKLVDKDRGAETQRADLLLAITGWQAGAGSGKMKLVTCEYCFRKVVTSFYKSAPISESRDEVTISQDKGSCSPGHGTKRKREEDELDPVHEHRPWCIWVLNDDSGKPGWLVFSECLLRNVESSHDDSRLSTSSVDAFKHDVEKIISSWREVVKHPTVQKTATS